MRRILAIWVTKILITVGKLVGKKGSSTPGRFALKICPTLLKELSAEVREGIICVCGTNGKTTTNNLLFSALQADGKRVVCNNVGANMLHGVVTAFADAADIFGRLNADYACIEVDEISTVKVFAHFQPNYMVLTNLFRDQLDRYGEIDITMDYLLRALKMTDRTKLIINGDDPLSVALAKKSGKSAVYYGVSEDVGISLNETKEGRFCAFCGEELKYNYYHYSQLGDYECPRCGFIRPHIDFAATDVNLDGGISFDVANKRISVQYRGFYNIYNILAAYTACSNLGAGLASFDGALAAYRPQIGRMESFNINGKQVIFNLSKNPAGFNQAISAVLGDKRSKDVVVVINDNEQDGTDVSWLWDVDFERFADANVKTFTASGIRHHDMCVRFKYAGMVASNIGDVETAVRAALATDSGVLYVLVNYTALFKTQDILKKLEGEHK